MDVIFLLLLIFFFVLLYVVPAIILIGVSALAIRWIVSKFKNKDTVRYDDYNGNWQCDVCGDSEDWHKHAP